MERVNNVYGKCDRITGSIKLDKTFELIMHDAESVAAVVSIWRRTG